MPGPARTPRRLRLFKGTLQATRDDEPAAWQLPAFDKLPPPPSWLLKNAHAVREYRRLGPFMITHKLLGPATYSAFATMCALHGRNVDYFARGITPTAAHISMYRALCGSLGLLAMNLSSPAAKTANPFAKHVKQKPLRSVP